MWPTGEADAPRRLTSLFPTIEPLRIHGGALTTEIPRGQAVEVELTVAVRSTS